MAVVFTKAGLEWWAFVAEIAGAAAVVVSLVYLSRQIRDNNKLLRSQAHYNALSLVQRPLEMMVENESLSGVLSQCDADPNGVPATTWQRCLNYYLIQIDSWESMYYENHDGSLPQQIWSGADAYFKSVVQKRAGYVRFWNEAETAFGEPFRAYAARVFRGLPVLTGE
jgi:hypothetical protein